MRRFLPLLLGLLSVFALEAVAIAQEATSELLGTWQATSIIRSEEEAPPEAVKLMRMTFSKDDLRVRGNFRDDREVSCAYKIDAEKSPKHLEFLPAGEKKPVLGIYRIKNGILEICLRNNSDHQKGRPESFAATKDDPTVLIKFERVRPKPDKP